MSDFRIINHGSVCTVIAQTDEARAFAEERIAVPGWMGSPESFTTDTRVAMTLASDLFEEGFEIEGL